MKIAWVLLAEGAALDTRGVITAVGLNQNVFSSAQLPAQTKRVVIAHVISEPGEIKPGIKYNLTFQIVDPKGNVLVAQNAQMSLGQVIWPDLPVSTDLPVEMLVNLAEYGTHRFTVTVQIPDGDSASGEVELYVLPPPGEQHPAISIQA